MAESEDNPIMRTLTTEEAETIYHVPAATFAQWCHEGKLAGASKVGGEWQLAIPDIDAFLSANPALRPAPTQSENRAWVIFGAIATVLGFVVDAVALYDIIRGGDRTLLWILAGLLSLALWVAELVVLRPQLRKDRPLRLTVQSRFTSKPLLIAARIVALGMPLMLVLGVVGYNVWRVVPPSQTVVLVADFRDQPGGDSARVTQSLVDGMREILKQQPNIKVKRLNRFIPAEGGSEQARAIGNRPEHKAAFVVWGDYTLQPDPELHVHFDILRQTETYLGRGQAQDYGPTQVQQPTMFDFKAKLAAYLGQLTAFASGLALFDAGKNLEAVPLFDAAAQDVDRPLAREMERPIHFYRGTNYELLGRSLDAKPDLESLIPIPAPGETTQALDSIAVAALSNLGLVARNLGDYGAAKAYHEQALALDRQLGNRLGEAANLRGLGNVAEIQGDYAGAKAYHEQALALDRQLGNRLGEAADLGNLGLVARNLGDYAGAKAYHEQALALDRQLGNRLGEAADLGNLGLVARNLWDYAGAKAYHERALALDRKLGQRLGEANQLGNLGLVATAQGDYAGARTYYEQALALDRQLGNRQGEANQLGNLGNAAAAQGDYAGARTYHEQALALDRQLGNRQGEANQLGNLGNAAAAQGDYAGARTYHEQALALDRQLGNRLGEAADLGILGLVAQDQGDYAGAKAYLERSAELYRQMSMTVPPAVQATLKKLTGQK